MRRIAIASGPESCRLTRLARAGSGAEFVCNTSRVDGKAAPETTGAGPAHLLPLSRLLQSSSHRVGTADGRRLPDVRFSLILVTLKPEHALDALDSQFVNPARSRVREDI